MSPLIKYPLLVFLVAALLAACSPASTPAPAPWLDNPYAPQPADEILVRDGVRVVKVEVLTLNTFPPKVSLNLAFFTPTACHQYRVTVSQPDAGGRINVEVYSLRKQDQVCNLMQLATPTEISLDLGSLPAGHYTVWVNGSQAAAFDA
jgi:hypothetical protein